MFQTRKKLFKIIFVLSCVFSSPTLLHADTRVNEAIKHFSTALHGKSCTLDWQSWHAYRPASKQWSPDFGVEPLPDEFYGLIGKTTVVLWSDDVCSFDDQSIGEEKEMVRHRFVKNADWGYYVHVQEHDSDRVVSIGDPKDMTMSLSDISPSFGFFLPLINGVEVHIADNDNVWIEDDKASTGISYKRRSRNVKETLKIEELDGLPRLSSYSAICTSSSDGSKFRSRTEVKFFYDTESGTNDLYPTKIQCDEEIIAEGKSSFARRHIELTQMKSANKFEKPGDIIKDIENGTRVTSSSHPGIEFEWRDGEIVRTIDRKKVKSLSGFRFTGAKWFLPTVMLVFATIGAGWWWIRRRYA